MLPKVELHCHLDGVLDPAMLRDIVQHDPAFPLVPEEFERAYPVEHFFDWWKFTKPLGNNLLHLYPILDRHVKRLKAQQVRYTELMIPSSTVPRDAAQAADEFGAFRHWITQQEAGEIQIELLIAVGRHKSAEEFDMIAALALELYDKGLIVGVALAGEERGNPVQRFQRSFPRLHAAGVGIEIHAGEWCGPETVWDALNYGYPNRIGHGVAVFQDEKLIDTIRERHIHLEMCPTSNLKTGAISRLEQHPIATARDLDLSFSINTDDPGIVGCSMESEYELVSRLFGFDDNDFQAIFEQSLNARFQPHLRI